MHGVCFVRRETKTKIGIKFIYCHKKKVVISVTHQEYFIDFFPDILIAFLELTHKEVG